MRFKTLFELRHPYTPSKVKKSKKEMQESMGQLIGESFGWQEKVDAEFTRHTLEIEAFPMDKWMEFKKELLAEFEGSYIDVDRMLTRIEKLESFSKPSVDAITNQQLNK